MRDVAAQETGRLETPDDAAILDRFAPDGSDPVGLLAYALHRQALLAFRRDFAAQRGRAPDPAEESAFLVGEFSVARLAAYHARAEAMIGTPATPMLKRKARWPWFGMWVDAPMAPPGQPEKINWRGLFFRLLVLLLAVVTTAILLRVLVVKS